MFAFTCACDSIRNRLTQNDNGTPTSYGYDDANRLISVNGVNYTWDDNGNLLSDGVNTYQYDQANRLIAVNGQTSNVTFAYNGLGDRLQQTVGGVTTNYTLDLNAGLTQVLADGTNTYLYGAGRIAEYGNAMQYFGADGLGSVRQLYDTSGAALANKRYDPFGNVLSASGTATSAYGFTGEWTDATELVYLRARYYDPMQGRFTTRDTWEGDVQRPLSLHKWNYVEANPVTLTDPSGKCPLCVIAALGLLAMVASGCDTPAPTDVPPVPVTRVPLPPTLTRSPTGTTQLPTVRPTITALSTNTPTASPTPTWLEEQFIITHYTFALEADPIYANDARVSANGLPAERTYREGFLYGPRGILLQGTGLAEDGNHITIDWTHGNPNGRNTYFTYGIGGAVGNPIAWETVATSDPRLPAGTRLVIEIYPGRVFTVNDTGGAIGAGRIDIFVGAITIEQADQLGRQMSRVGIVP